MGFYKKCINEIYPAIQGEGKYAGHATIVVRFVGCTHRCWFGEDGGWCDSWRNSIHPEKSLYTITDVIEEYKKYPHIKEMMITGGSPTMHLESVNALNNFAKKNDIFVTIETEGSHRIETDNPIGFVSISPKFNNTVPMIGIKTPGGKEVTQKMIDQHNSLRLNKDAILYNIYRHSDYQLKVVINPIKQPDIWNEISNFIKGCNIPNNKVWIMPPGDDREKVMKNYPDVISFCWGFGYNFTGRPQIIAFDNDRFV
jgi:7-carboxy-7-deazaguanine synthase